MPINQQDKGEHRAVWTGERHGDEAQELGRGDLVGGGSPGPSGLRIISEVVVPLRIVRMNAKGLKALR